MNVRYTKIAGIDVHKQVLYVVISGPDKASETWPRQRFGATTSDLARLREWLQSEQVGTVVMESTAQYWKPVWMALEPYFQLLLAQALSNRARAGRKTDYGDTIRLIKRLQSEELVLSFVPDPEQRDWRLLTRTRVQYASEVTRLRNRLEGLLEECQIKLSSLLSDLFGVTGLRILRALAEGETDPAQLAELRVGRLKASAEEFAKALQGNVRPVCRLLLQQYLDQLEQFQQRIAQLDQRLAEHLKLHQEHILRLCQMPGIATNAAEQIIAEVGPTAATFPTPGQLCSWVGASPGRQESAGQSSSDKTPKGNRSMRRVLSQCAWAAVRTRDSFFPALFRRLVPRLGVAKALWAVAHRMLRIIWRILYLGEHYRERGPLVEQQEIVQRRFRRVARQMAAYGFQIQITPSTKAAAPA